MRRTHYDTLGISEKATSAEIRAAYRRLALQHHPDRSTAPDAAEKFSRISEAYQVVSDPDRRREYDTLLTLEAERQARASARVQATAASPQRPRATIASDLARLGAFFSRGKFHEAESLAHTILEKHPREAVPYAVLGDIARARGEINHAANMYAHALQMDPRNVLYQQRYEELLSKAAPAAAAAKGSQVQVAAVGAGVLVTGCAAFYLALANERPMLPSVGLVDTFTLGSVVMLFLVGVALGSAFTVGGLLDRFASVNFSSQGKVSPTLALATVAIVSFWAAAILYGALGLSHRTLNVSMNRLLGATAGALVLATLAATVSPSLNPLQVFLWGGNLVYLGGVCGWMTADALRR